VRSSRPPVQWWPFFPRVRLPESLIGIFRQALAEQGYLEGRNVVIDYRHGDNQYERLAGLATEFARRQVTVIAALNSPPALAARAATTTIPIVFMIPDDPVKLGLAISLSRPGGNATGVSFLLADLGSKQLGLLRELVPHAKRIGLMVNPHNANIEASKTEVVMAASAIGVDLKVVEASGSSAGVARPLPAVLVCCPLQPAHGQAD
jgi:putative ABC transport system substrate-binding protein